MTKNHQPFPKQTYWFLFQGFAIALSGIIGAVTSTAIAMEKGQEITQQFVQTVYGDYSGMLTIAAVAMVAVAMAGSVAIRKMIAKSENLESTKDMTAKAA